MIWTNSSVVKRGISGVGISLGVMMICKQGIHREDGAESESKRRRTCVCIDESKCLGPLLYTRYAGKRGRNRVFGRRGKAQR